MSLLGFTFDLEMTIVWEPIINKLPMLQQGDHLTFSYAIVKGNNVMFFTFNYSIRLSIFNPKYWTYDKCIL